VAAFYYVMNLRISQKNMKSNLDTRQAQLFVSVYQTFYSKNMAEADRIITLYPLNDVNDYENLRKNEETDIAFRQWTSYLEGVGVLVRQNLLDIHVITLLMSGQILWFWRRFGSFFIQMRKEQNFPRLMIELEYLAQRVEEYSKDHPELFIVSPDDSYHPFSP
jgi:hypothetical protein